MDAVRAQLTAEQIQAQQRQAQFDKQRAELEVSLRTSAVCSRFCEMAVHASILVSGPCPVSSWQSGATLS